MQFPPFPASADSFPFVATDRVLMEKGLYATSHAVNSGTSARAFVDGISPEDTLVAQFAGGFTNVAVGMIVNEQVPGPDNIPSNTVVIEKLGNERVRISNLVSFATPQLLFFDNPATPGLTAGQLSGSSLLLDQNLVGSLTCALSGPSVVPLNSPSELGLNVRASEARFKYHNPANVLADGEAAPNNHLDSVELMQGDGVSWALHATVGAGAEKVALPSVPAGRQFWATRSVDKNGNRSVLSNVTISGPTAVLGVGTLAEDADEPNGRSSFGDATPLIVPVTNRPGSVWPAGEEDNFEFYARGGDIITASVSATGIDFRNDLDPVLMLLDNNGDVLATGLAPSPGSAVSVMYTVPKKGNSTALRRHVVQVVDKAGSVLDPTSSPRVLVPPTYRLDVDVQTPALLQQIRSTEVPISALANPDEFAFANTGRNPARGQVTLGFVIPRSAVEGVQVKLRIYDVTGRMVSTLVNEAKGVGTHYASWAGHDSRGNRLASGPYFARLQAGSWSRTLRIDLVK
jgi:hypothetical protein